jgi:hypothetical protein
MLADVLTKNLPAPDFARHRDVMSGLMRYTSPDLLVNLRVPGPRICLPRTQTTATARLHLHVSSGAQERQYAVE